VVIVAEREIKFLPVTRTTGYRVLWAAATNHGNESGLDHEVGDLQVCLREAWVLLTEAQRLTVMGEVSDLARWADDEDIDLPECEADDCEEQSARGLTLCEDCEMVAGEALDLTS